MRSQRFGIYLQQILGWLAFAAASACPMRHSVAQEPRVQFLQTLLRKLSLLTGDVFVLERWAEGAQAHDDYTAVIDFAVINAYTAPEKLISAYFPRFRVEKSPKISNLYFVVDARLYELRDYEMTNKTPYIYFQGSDREYLEKLREFDSALKPLDWYSIPSLDKIYIRYPTPKFTVGMEAADVRHALTECVDTQRTRGIAWVATTRVKDGKQETEIAYTSDAVFREIK